MKYLKPFVLNRLVLNRLASIYLHPLLQYEFSHFPNESTANRAHTVFSLGNPSQTKPIHLY